MTRKPPFGVPADPRLVSDEAGGPDLAANETGNHRGPRWGRYALLILIVGIAGAACNYLSRWALLASAAAAFVIGMLAARSTFFTKL
jgi:hypothetical protein